MPWQLYPRCQLSNTKHVPALRRKEAGVII